MVSIRCLLGAPSVIRYACLPWGTRVLTYLVAVEEVARGQSLYTLSASTIRNIFRRCKG